MGRTLFTILSAISLALWLAVAVLFVRSGWIQDTWDRHSTETTTIWSCNGRVSWRRVWPQPPPQSTPSEDVRAKRDLDGRWRYIRFDTSGYRAWYKIRYSSGSDGPPVTETYVVIVVPYWPFLLVLAILPGLWTLRFQGLRRKKREGLCRMCAYDLRAHAPGQVCPECGTAVPGDLVRKSMAPG